MGDMVRVGEVEDGPDSQSTEGEAFDGVGRPNLGSSSISMVTSPTLPVPLLDFLLDFRRKKVSLFLRSDLAAKLPGSDRAMFECSLL